MSGKIYMRKKIDIQMRSYRIHILCETNKNAAALLAWVGDQNLLYQIRRCERVCVM